MLLGIFLTLLIVFNVLQLFIIKRLIFRLSQYDNILHAVAEDMDIFVDYTDELLTKSSFSRSPDVMAFCKNMSMMRGRLYEHVAEYTAVSNKTIEKKPKIERPVVKD